MGLLRPHHDGSERHVSTLEATLGDIVTVWLRVPNREPATRVWVRTTPDGEPHFDAAVVDRVTDHEAWWRADIVARNAVTNYRFLLDGGSRGYRFVNGTGVHTRTVSDVADFRISTYAPPPRWLADTTFYQVFPDRFASSGAQRAWPDWADVAAWGDPVVTDGQRSVHQVYGGDLQGVEAHLDHLTSMGIGGLYLTPFFPAPSSHRYDAETFDHVDPYLGGDDALVHLVAACHDRGIRVIGDLTINHVGSDHDWFQAAQADPSSAEADFFWFRDHPNDYEAWFGHASLPKLDLRDPELNRRLLDGPDSVTARWLRPPCNLDGWRVDVANMAGRLRDVDVNQIAARTMRATIADVKPDAYLVAEHAYDASRELDGDGWHGVMNYLSFTRPAWCWLRRDDNVKFLGDPLPVPRFSGQDTVDSIVELLAMQPWRSTVAGFNLLGSHDTSRFRTVCGTTERHIAGAGLMYTMPGVPMVFAGDEFELEGVDGDGARQPMPWQGDNCGSDVLDAYRGLGALRQRSRALRHGGLRWVHASDDVLVYLRESLDERVLVQVGRAQHEPIEIDATTLDGDIGSPLFGTDDCTVDKNAVVVLPAGDAGVRVWELT